MFVMHAYMMGYYYLLYCWYISPPYRGCLSLYRVRPKFKKLTAAAAAAKAICPSSVRLRIDRYSMNLSGVDLSFADYAHAYKYTTRTTQYPPTLTLSLSLFEASAASAHLQTIFINNGSSMSPIMQTCSRARERARA